MWASDEKSTVLCDEIEVRGKLFGPSNPFIWSVSGGGSRSLLGCLSREEVLRPYLKFLRKKGSLSRERAARSYRIYIIAFVIVSDRKREEALSTPLHDRLTPLKTFFSESNTPNKNLFQNSVFRRKKNQYTILLDSASSSFHKNFSFPRPKENPYIYYSGSRAKPDIFINKHPFCTRDGHPYNSVSSLTKSAIELFGFLW